MKNLLPKSAKPSDPKRKSKDLRKVEGQRDRALGRLLNIKATKKRKKARRQRRILGRQVVSLTIRHTQALFDGEI